jgi:acyl-CoA synthetase (AMP-forming)/AMP-acid ligase II
MTELFRRCRFAPAIRATCRAPSADRCRVSRSDRQRIRVCRDGIGELWIKSPAMMDGYWTRPMKREAIADGWFKPVIVTVSTQGYVEIVGRVANNSPWRYSVFPQESKRCCSHPSVAEARS